jgi:hypothetical protein
VKGFFGPAWKASFSCAALAVML